MQMWLVQIVANALRDFYLKYHVVISGAYENLEKYQDSSLYQLAL